MVEGLGLQWSQAWTCNPSTLLLLGTGIPYAGDYKKEVMRSFPSIPRSPILKGLGGTEITTLPIFYLISCPVLILLSCAWVEGAELGTDSAVTSSSSLSTAKY